jgi:hypothetical protein
MPPVWRGDAAGKVHEPVVIFLPEMPTPAAQPAEIAHARRYVGAQVHRLAIGDVFIGSEALARGTVTRHHLQRSYRAIYPDVYVREPAEPSLRGRTVAAWLWSRRRAIIAGTAASALHGARWVDAGSPIELIWKNGRPPAGLVVRNDTLAQDERDHPGRWNARHDAGADGVRPGSC